MKRFFTVVIFFILPFLTFSEDAPVFGGLNVTWIDGNTIEITGGNISAGNSPQYTVVTNFFGTCTNCVNISPAELRSAKKQITDLCDDVLGTLFESTDLAQQIEERCRIAINEIGHYVYFDISANANLSTSSNHYNEIIRQDYDYSYVHGKQGELTHDYYSHLAGNDSTLTVRQSKFRMSVSYANGIYDYSNDVVAPTYNQIIADASRIGSIANGQTGNINTIRSIVEGLSEEPCECNGGSGGSCNGSGGSFDCPCREQLDAIRDYVSHLDSDAHSALEDLSQMKEDLVSIDTCLTSFAKAMTSVFLNDATIFVDDGFNSWSNVYSRGSSELYAYNHSNILQRIELLLYGLAFSSSSSLTNDIADVTTNYLDSIDSMSQGLDGSLNEIEEASEDYENDVRSLGNAIEGLFRNLTFLGSGNLQNFSLMEPTRVFDEYDLEFEFTRSSDFSDLQRICRTAFQIFYLLTSLVFMIVFWFKVVRFTYDKALFVLDFFNKVLT